MPEVARLRPDIAFTLALAPAINWLLQGRYNTRAAMAAAGRMKRNPGARSYWRHIQTLLEQPDGYAQYRREYGTAAALSADRWRFIRVNMASDATVGLRHFATPVHLITGGRDVSVDADETERVYRQTIRPRC